MEINSDVHLTPRICTRFATITPPAPSPFFQHLHFDYNTVTATIRCILEDKEKKKNVTSLSLTVLSKPNDCRDLLWIFSSFCLGFLPADGPADARFMWDDLRSTHGPATWDHFVNLILAVALIFHFLCVYVCARACVFRGKYTAQLEMNIYCLFSHVEPFHPPSLFCLSVVEQRHLLWPLRKENEKTLMLSTNSLA